MAKKKSIKEYILTRFPFLKGAKCKENKTGFHFSKGKKKIDVVCFDKKRKKR